jgi:hypothetical protein
LNSQSTEKLLVAQWLISASLIELNQLRRKSPLKTYSENLKALIESVMEVTWDSLPGWPV